MLSHAKDIYDKEENQEYLNRQIVTYLGNKRSLLPFIDIGIKKVLSKLRKNKTWHYCQIICAEE